MPTHADIVASARGWIGTRFHHQGRLKRSDSHKGGVDCLGLLVGIAKELDLRDSEGTPLAGLDKTDYTHHPDTEHLRSRLDSILNPIPVGDIRAGDILLLEIERLPQHLAVVSNLGGALGIIHAYAPARAVVEHQLDAMWQRRVTTAYRLF